MHLPDLALSTGEAAAVIGVHWTRIAKMAAAGQLKYKEIEGGWGPKSRSIKIYSLHDCEREFAEYLEMRAADDPWLRRPRTKVDDRRPMLKKLAKVEPITFKDAIGTGEVADLLRIDPKLAVRYAEEGVIRARKPIDDARGSQQSQSRWWIYSLDSAKARRGNIIEKELDGTKRGIRKFYEG